MNASREPLHQPPNPEDLRRAPPATPACARVRGWLRDFVDGDLETARVRELEEHVHRCRVCAVELARAEHELLRVRQAFRELRAGEIVLSPDFAARVVERLVVDETSLVGPDTLDRATLDRATPDRAVVDGAALRATTERAQASANDAARVAGGTARDGERSGFRPGIALVVGLGLLLLVGVVLELMRGPAGGPGNEARLYLVRADRAYHLQQLLGQGDSLGDRQSLRVRSGGGAKVEWQDAAPPPRPQPAATLQMRGEGEVRLENGEPLLVNGTIDVQTHRGVSIPLADGSRVDLGIGEYTIAAEGGLDSQDPMLAAPEDLFVTIEVRSGQEASIARSGFATAIVAAGNLGMWRGSSETTVMPSGGFATRGDRASEPREPAAGVQSQHHLIGRAQEQTGQPIGGADVLITYRAGGVQIPASQSTGAEGMFLFELAAPADGAFALVYARPPGNRTDLGIFAPDALPVVRYVDDALLPPIVFARSLPLFGAVRDEQNVPIAGAHVVPCIVDEVFGAVAPLVHDRRFSDANGSFRIDGLPGRLPPQQALYLVVFHEHASSSSCVAVAVPPRAAAGAELPLPPITVPRPRWVRVQGVSPQQPVHVIEEIPGLPRGAGLRRRVFPSGLGVDGDWVDVGRGELWLLEPGANQVRALSLGTAIPIEQYRPTTEPPQPYGLRFRGVVPLQGTGIELVTSFRHSNAFGGSANGATSRVLSVLDIAGNPVGGAQVFLSDGLSPVAMAGARFLGFTAANGMLGWNELGGTHVTVIAADGRVVSESLAQGAGGNLSVELPACGRVLLGPARRPGPGEPPVVVLRFEQIDGEPDSRRPAAVRFASAMSDWEARDLLPGEYRVVIGGSAHQVTVPPNGFYQLD